MALLQQMCSAPSIAARVVRSRKTVSTTPIRRTPHVLLGMSELDLQQLAIDLGQVLILLLNPQRNCGFFLVCTEKVRIFQQKYRGKQLHQLLRLRKFRILVIYVPLAFRNGLQEAGWKVGRSPVHQVVKAADGTIKVLHDNRLIETVGIPVEDEKGFIRLTACVSSQPTCPKSKTSGNNCAQCKSLSIGCTYDYFDETGRRVSFEYKPEFNL